MSQSPIPARLKKNAHTFADCNCGYHQYSSIHSLDCAYVLSRKEMDDRILEPQRIRNKIRYRLHKYSLSDEAFNLLFKKQNHVCAICKKANWNNNEPYIDHDHITKKVRGILCGNCNSALGHIKDDPKIAQAIIDYLHRFNGDAGEART